MHVKYLLLPSWPCWVQQYKQVYFFKSGDVLLCCFPLFFSKLWKVCFSNFKPHWDTRRSTTQIQERDIEKGVEGRRIVSKPVKKAGGFFFLHCEKVLFWDEWRMLSNVKQNMSHQGFPKKICVFKKKKSVLFWKGHSEMLCFEND